MLSTLEEPEHAEKQQTSVIINHPPTAPHILSVNTNGGEITGCHTSLRISSGLSGTCDHWCDNNASRHHHIKMRSAELSTSCRRHHIPQSNQDPNSNIPRSRSR
ncbi:hypothetical protein A0H81_01890 [Grifola frondosa]|uniref:Uncharacterized protein n=1 Tax=Grifola frondosa TaxID=5627 RepID=A0A1C7MM03_GRIFR|nr:hypothetical protein A0H81_01890 [Grifola frondosa]